MKKKRIIITSLFLITAFLACNQATQQKAGVNETTAKDVEKIVSSNGGEGCYIPYQAKVCELMEKGTIAKILDIDVNQIKVEDAMKTLHAMGKNKDKPYKGSEFAFCEYKWEDKNKKIKEYIEALDRELEVPMYAIVHIGNFAPRKDVTAFQQYYRNVSEEEMSNTLEKAGEKMKKDGKYTQEQVGTAKDMGKGLAKGRIVTYIDGLGEAAASIRTKAYGEQTELVVYYKGNEFQVEVKVAGKTHAENMELTKKIALEVLKKCK